MGKNEACRLMADIVELGDGIDRVAEELGNGSLASWTLGHVADALLWAALHPEQASELADALYEI